MEYEWTSEDNINFEDDLDRDLETEEFAAPDYTLRFSPNKPKRIVRRSLGGVILDVLPFRYPLREVTITQDPESGQVVVWLGVDSLEEDGLHGARRFREIMRGLPVRVEVLLGSDELPL